MGEKGDKLFEEGAASLSFPFELVVISKCTSWEYITLYRMRVHYIECSNVEVYSNITYNDADGRIQQLKMICEQIVITEAFHDSCQQTANRAVDELEIVIKWLTNVKSSGR